MGTVAIVNHPLVDRDLTLLRRQDTDCATFRLAMRRIARALALRAFADLPTQEITIATPLESTVGKILPEPVVLVPILRAGLGLVDGFLDVLPEASVFHLGLARDEQTLRPTCYLSKLSSLTGRERVVILDPMLATGGSAINAIEKVLNHNAKQAPLFACILAAPEGIVRVQQKFPNVNILTACRDRCLDERSWIRPGLGDAGDRLFGG